MEFREEISKLNNLFVSLSDDDSFLTFLNQKKNKKEIKIQMCEVMFDLFHIETKLNSKKDFHLNDLYSMWVERYYLYKELHSEILRDYSLFLIRTISSR